MSCNFISFSQLNTFLTKSDYFSKKRLITVGTSSALTWTASDVVLYSAWYSNYSTSKFHLFDDRKEWLQMDKVGHFYTANKLSSSLSTIYQWTGLSRKKSIITGSLLSWGYQSSLEIFDGYSNGWGFSWSDMSANTLGVLAYSLQEYFLNDQFVNFKMSAHLSPYAKLRPNVLGSNIPERLLKDYNGQTYWMSFSPFYLSKNDKLPKWLCLSLGYGIDSKIDGMKNHYYDINSNSLFLAKRMFLFSLDIDFKKLPINNKRLKQFISVLNMVKVPLPTLIYVDNKLHFKGIYF